MAGLLAVGLAVWGGWVALQMLARKEAAAVLERGRLHFEGATGLVGRMAGHELALPALATRCANCHALGEPGEAGNPVRAGLASSAPATATATVLVSAAGAGVPALGQQGLSSARQRRGGPASRYDSSSLCRLLALGQDPVHVLISTAMPRYEIRPEQCQELWAYLTAK